MQFLLFTSLLISASVALPIPTSFDPNAIAPAQPIQQQSSNPLNTQNSNEAPVSATLSTWKQLSSAITAFRKRHLVARQALSFSNSDEEEDEDDDVPVWIPNTVVTSSSTGSNSQQWNDNNYDDSGDSSNDNSYDDSDTTYDTDDFQTTENSYEVTDDNDDDNYDDSDDFETAEYDTDDSYETSEAQVIDYDTPVDYEQPFIPPPTVITRPSPPMIVSPPPPPPMVISRPSPPMVITRPQPIPVPVPIPAVPCH